MDGTALLYSLRNTLQEDSTSTFLDTKTSYDYLYEAATEFVKLTNCISATQTITTVAETTNYDLSYNFMKQFMRDSNNEFFIRYYDTSAYTFVNFREYGAVRASNNTTSTSIPWNYTIMDDRTAETIVTGTATSAGASSGGESTLTDSTATFTANPGDIVHNTTDGSVGVVVSRTSTTALVTALFGGTNNDWTSSDAYVIVMAPKKQLVVDPPSSTAGHTITIEYICSPDPVYSNYRSYRIPAMHLPAVVKYAAWLYKYRDREPSFGDAWYKYWVAQVERAKNTELAANNQTSFRVNMKKRSYTDQSYR